MSAAFRLTIEGAPRLLVHSFETYERSHVASEARVVFHLAPGEHGPVGDVGDLDCEELLGKRATLEIAAPSSGTPRRFHGLVDAIETEVGRATVTIVPRVMPLAQGRDHRVFVEESSLRIAERLLLEAGLDVEVRVATPPAARPQCVQAFEPTLAFVRRILAEDGISLWVEHGEQEDVVVFGADASACADLPGGASLPYRHGGGLVHEESVFELASVSSLAHDGASTVDYDPERPAVDQSASVGGDRYVRFVYPGHHRSPEEGRLRAQLFLEESRSEAALLRARSRCVRLAVGFVVEITDAPNDVQNGRFRVLELRQRGQDFAGGAQPSFESELVAVSIAVPVRPKRTSTKGLGGLQTMTVTGSAGEEINTDARGAIKAHFRWDRLRPLDDTASTWIRPLQPALSGGFLQPRVGWEVLVGFMGEPAAVGDTPIELGRLIHGEAPPIEPLPAQKVRGSWGTLSTPGGGKTNQLRFDDAAGREGMLLHAAALLNERTENDRDVTVVGSETNLVGGDHTCTVTLQQENVVSGAQTYTVGGNRQLTTVGALAISAATESVLVAGTRKFDVGGDFATKSASLTRVVGAAENVLAIQETNRHVSGASTIAVGGTWTEVGGVTASMGVLGASTLKVSGPMSIRASDVSINATTLTERYAAAYEGRAGDKLSLEAPSIKLKAGPSLAIKGADVSFKATSKIVVKAGGVTITITPGSIKVKGKLKGDATSVVSNKEEVG